MKAGNRPDVVHPSQRYGGRGRKEDERRYRERKEQIKDGGAAEDH